MDDSSAEAVLDARRAVADRLADPTKIRTVADPLHESDVWTMQGTDLLLDIQFRSKVWAEEELDWRLVRLSPQLGYSTTFWRSIRDGIPLFERSDWHPGLQRRAATSYPEALREKIITMNRTALGREQPLSFFHQAAKAITTGDLIAAQHRGAKWMASYFDVLFAANRVLHPGEKRLVAFAERECAVLPESFAPNVTEFTRSSSAAMKDAVALMELMVERLDEVIARTELPRPNRR